MGDVYSDGNVRVAYVPAIANTAAPTTAELGAGILLQWILTPTGLMGFEAETKDVDNTALASTVDTSGLGRDSYSKMGLQFKKQSGTDTAYQTMVRGATGYIVIRRGIAETTSWASGQAVEVFPVIFGQTKNLAPEANSLQKWEVQCFLTAAPNPRAAVA